MTGNTMTLSVFGGNHSLMLHSLEIHHLKSCLLHRWLVWSQFGVGAFSGLKYGDKCSVHTEFQVCNCEVLLIPDAYFSIFQFCAISIIQCWIMMTDIWNLVCTRQWAASTYCKKSDVDWSLFVFHSCISTRRKPLQWKYVRKRRKHVIFGMQASYSTKSVSPKRQR